MKTASTALMLTGIVGISLFSTGCINIRTREVPPPTTVVTTTTYKPGYVATTLPSGYQTRVYRGTKYYYYDGVYYQPRGERYIVVPQPR